MANTVSGTVNGSISGDTSSQNLFGTGVGGQQAQVSLMLSTFPVSPGALAGNMAIVARDNGDYSANISVQTLAPYQGPSPSYEGSGLMTLLTMNSTGTLTAPSMPDRPMAGQRALAIDSHGNIAPYPTYSDAEVTPFVADFEKLLGLQPMEFKERASEHTTVGYEPQQLESLGLKYLLAYGKEGKPMAVQYSLLPVYLLELIRGLSRKVEALQKELESSRTQR